MMILHFNKNCEEKVINTNQRYLIEKLKTKFEIDMEKEFLERYTKGSFMNEAEMRILLKDFHQRGHNENVTTIKFDAEAQIHFEKFLQSIKGKACITVSGGHDLPRSELLYLKMMFLGKQLAKKFDYIFQGGGYGVMEAVSIGILLSEYSLDEIAQHFSELNQSKDIKRYIQDIKSKTNPKLQEKVVSIATFQFNNSINDISQNLFCFYNLKIRQEKLMKSSEKVIFVQGENGTFSELTDILPQDSIQGFQGFIYEKKDLITKTLDPIVNQLKRLQEIKYQTLICKHGLNCDLCSEYPIQSYIKNQKSCNVCMKNVTKLCGKCRSVYYCSKECQQDDWSQHKLKCQQ